MVHLKKTLHNSMNKNYASLISQEKSYPINGVKAVVSLLNEGATVPFISRYRKEKTGNRADETAGRTLVDQRSRSSRSFVAEAPD